MLHSRPAKHSRGQHTAFRDIWSENTSCSSFPDKTERERLHNFEDLRILCLWNRVLTLLTHFVQMCWILARAVNCILTVFFLLPVHFCVLYVDKYTGKVVRVVVCMSMLVHSSYWIFMSPAPQIKLFFFLTSRSHERLSWLVECYNILSFIKFKCFIDFCVCFLIL
jgi:hypothetical protein